MAEIVIVDSPSTAGSFVAEMVRTAIAADPRFVLGVATGSTPLTTYRTLAQLQQSSPLPLAELSAFALDEYLGLPAGHPESYRAVIDREVVDAIGLGRDRVHLPEVDAAERFEGLIGEAGGIDLQLLGIGTTGHIGFNEPGSPLDSRTRIVELTEQTRVDNARFFSSLDEVPTHAVTQGIGTILEARKLVMIAFGEHKAPAIAGALEGEVHPGMPASALQLHDDALFVLDEAAASALARRQGHRRLSAA